MSASTLVNDNHQWHTDSEFGMSTSSMDM